MQNIRVHTRIVDCLQKRYVRCHKFIGHGHNVISADPDAHAWIHKSSIFLAARDIRYQHIAQKT